MKGKRTGKAEALAAAQEGAKEVAVAAAQEGAKGVAVAGAAWGAEERHREPRRADCWAFGSGVGVCSGFLLRRVFRWFSGVWHLVLLYDIYLALMCARYMLALTSATRVCSHICRAVCHLSAVCCFRPPGVGTVLTRISACSRFSSGPRAAHAHHGGAAWPRHFFFPDGDSSDRAWTSSRIHYPPFLQG
jgi:hypothetical protein